jgi:hypothetical protein
MPPKLQPKSKLFLMTPEAILNLTNTTDFKQILYVPPPPNNRFPSAPPLTLSSRAGT